MKLLPRRQVLWPGLLVLAVSGCASVAPDAGFSAVSEKVEARTGAAPVWTRTAESRAEADAAADRLLETRIGMDEAVALAFLTSPALQAELETLGIARADLLTAILPPSPFIEITRPTTGNTLGLEVTAPLLDLLFWPQRAQAGQAHMAAAQARAAAILADTAAEVRLAYIDYVSARQSLDLYKQAESAGEAAQLAAEALFDAGNIARVDYDRQRQFAAQMTAERMQAEAQIAPAWERLVAILGLTQTQTEQLKLISRLPAPPDEALDAERLIAAAMEDSLQVAAAEAEVKQVAASRGVRNVEALIGELELSADLARSGGSWSDEAYGLGFALPVDLGVAGRQRVASEMRGALNTLQQARLDSLAEIRAGAQTVEAARTLALFHRDVSLPVSADVFDGVLRDFNAMQIGMFELLQSRRDRVEAGRGYIGAVTDYWRARAELERHVRVGDFLTDAGEKEEDIPPADEPQSSQPHEGHDH